MTMGEYLPLCYNVTKVKSIAVYHSYPEYGIVHDLIENLYSI